MIGHWTVVIVILISCVELQTIVIYQTVAYVEEKKIKNFKTKQIKINLPQFVFIVGIVRETNGLNFCFSKIFS